jgi:hypothetical protein
MVDGMTSQLMEQQKLSRFVLHANSPIEGQLGRD